MDCIVNWALFPISGHISDYKDDQLIHNGKLYRPPGTHKVMLFAHGNCTTVVRSWDTMTQLANICNVGIFAYEYPGYNGTTGEASPKTVNECANNAYMFLTQELNILPQDIILVGHSVGSGPTCWLANKYQNEIMLVLLISPFTCVKDVAINMIHWSVAYLFPTLFTNSYDNSKAIETLTCPLFIVHGQDDRVIPCEMSTSLFDSCPAKTKHVDIVAGKDHNSLHWDYDIGLPFLEFITKHELV